MSYEFGPGAILTVQITPETSPENLRSAVSLSFEVLKPYAPFSSAVVAKVALASASRKALGISDTTAVLKLHDRRCFTGRRLELTQSGAPTRPYSAESEHAYREFLLQLEAGSVKLTKDVDRDSWFQCRVHAPVGEFELALQRLAKRVHRSEVRAYQYLRTYQGSVIPRMYGTVQYTAKMTLPDGTYVEEVISGILIEHISDITLEQFAERFSTSCYANTPDIMTAVCRRAMEVSTHLFAIGALNNDVRLANMLVREPIVSDRTRQGLSLSPRCVVMIDLEYVRLRDDFASDAAWQKAQDYTDMFSTVGAALEYFLPPQVWKYNFDDWEEPPKHIV